MKKIISLILCVMLVVTMIPGMAFAETVPEAGPDWTFGNVPEDTVLSDNMKPTEGKTTRTFRLDPGSDASFEIFGYYNHGEGNLDAQVQVYSVTETVDEGITTATGQYLTDSAIQFDPQDGRYQFVPRYKNNSTGAESVMTFESDKLYYIVIETSGATLKDTISIDKLNVKNITFAAVPGGAAYDADAYHHWNSFKNDSNVAVTKPAEGGSDQLWDGQYFDKNFVAVETNSGFTFKNLSVGTESDGFISVSYGPEDHDGYKRVYINLGSIGNDAVITPIFEYNGSGSTTPEIISRLTFSTEDLSQASLETAITKLTNNLSIADGGALNVYAYRAVYADNVLTGLTSLGSNDELEVLYMVDFAPTFAEGDKGLVLEKQNGADNLYKITCNVSNSEFLSRGQGKLRYDLNIKDEDTRNASVAIVGTVGSNTSPLYAVKQEGRPILYAQGTELPNRFLNVRLELYLNGSKVEGNYNFATSGSGAANISYPGNNTFMITPTAAGAVNLEMEHTRGDGGSSERVFFITVNNSNVPQGGGNEGGEGPSGNPPGTLYWALVPEGAEPNTAPSGNIEWNSGVLDVTADGKAADNNVNIYLAFPNADSMELVNADPSVLSQDSSMFFELTKNGYIYTINPGSALKNDWIGISLPDGPSFEMGVRIGDGSGLAVEHNGQLLYGNGANTVIEIPECGGYSMTIYYNGVVTNGTWAFGDEEDSEVVHAGVSPDYKQFEVYLNPNAAAGASSEATLYYGSGAKVPTATYTVKVVPGVRLKNVATGEIVMPNGMVSGLQTATMQIMYGDKTVTDNYNWGTAGNVICDVIDNEDGTLTITTVGNGYGTISAEYNDIHSTFTWHGSGISDSANGARNVVMEIDGVQKQTGEKFMLEGSSIFTGKIYFNGVPFASDVYSIQTEGGSEKKCTAAVNSDGTFTLTTYDINGFTDIVFELTDDSGQEYRAVFSAQVSAPEAYILQFNNVDKMDNGTYIPGGFATIGIFKNDKQEKYVRYIVTDEEMRCVDDEHFVNVTPENLLVVYFDETINDYVRVSEAENPFTFEMVSGLNHLMKITYNREKDKNGPAYMLVYTDYKSDKYLGSENHYVENTIFLWTRKISDFVSWDKLQGENDQWWFDARVDTYEDFESVNDECDVKYVAVDLQSNLFGNQPDQITVKESSNMEIETDLASIVFDGKVLSQIDSLEKDVTLDVLRVEAEDEEYEEFEDVLKDATSIIDLTLNYDGGKISDFGDGAVTIKLDYELRDTGKKPMVYYVDENGTKHLVECQYDETLHMMTFKTDHFSMFEIEEIAVTSEDDSDEPGTGGSGSGSTGGNTGGGGFIPSKPADSLETAKKNANIEVNTYVDADDYADTEAAEIQTILNQANKDIEAAKSEEEIEAIEAAAKAAIDKIETAEEKALIAEVKDTKFKARSKMTKLNGKKAIKVYWNVPDDMDFDGFDVFRSTKKNSGYGKKPFFTTKKTSYINNKNLKLGTTYYYKVRAFKYVNDEKVYTQWSWKAWRTVK